MFRIGRKRSRRARPIGGTRPKSPLRLCRGWRCSQAPLDKTSKFPRKSGVARSLLAEMVQCGLENGCELLRPRCLQVPETATPCCTRTTRTVAGAMVEPVVQETTPSLRRNVAQRAKKRPVCRNVFTWAIWHHGRSNGAWSLPGQE